MFGDIYLERVGRFETQRKIVLSDFTSDASSVLSHDVLALAVEFKLQSAGKPLSLLAGTSPDMSVVNVASNNFLFLRVGSV